MREIRFRGLHRAGNWYFGVMCEPWENHKHDVIPLRLFFQMVETDTIDKETVCRYTGLKDKNGTPVYEGDILCFVPIGHKKFNKPYQPFVIFWDEKAARFSDWSPKEGERGAEVIGNIYENPDLLK